ncbi:MAG: glycine betaine ABC transporter substrate-binding protein [Bacteroidota bacterium]
MMESWLAFAIDRAADLWVRTGEHLVLTGISTFGAILIGVPLGVLASKVRSIRNPLTGMVGILQTIPSLAMLAILLALTGQIGVVPAIIALTLYALLPIVRNTLTGIEQVPPASVEAARGLGMTTRQMILLVELPLALPTIIAGIRTAAVVGVGIATLSAFIGAGGLGEFINRGLALSNTDLILLGAIPAAVLAVLIDGSIGLFQWGLQFRSPSGVSGSLRRSVALLAPIGIAAMGLFAAIDARDGVSDSDHSGNGTVRIASKSFTEQMILGEMMAQMIEKHTPYAVERRFNLGGTMICHEALAAGEVDMYAEYVGTALRAILQLDGQRSEAEAFDVVERFYAEQFDCVWLDPFGFENTYALAVTGQFAKTERLSSISDLTNISRSLRAGFPSEFMERPDGYPGLQETYGLAFGSVKDLEAALMYQALASGELDVISAYSTDGRIEAYNLAILEDDRSFFPPYHAAAVVRRTTLGKLPQLGPVLRRLSGAIDTDTMQRLNYRVDQDKISPADVAKEFLSDRGLLSTKE